MREERCKSRQNRSKRRPGAFPTGPSERFRSDLAGHLAPNCPPRAPRRLQEVILAPSGLDFRPCGDCFAGPRSLKPTSQKGYRMPLHVLIKTTVSRAHMFDMAAFPAPHSCNKLFSHTQSRAYLSAPRLPVPPTYVNADFSPLHRPTSEFMFSNSPDKSPAESTHTPGTAMPPSRRNRSITNSR